VEPRSKVTVIASVASLFVGLYQEVKKNRVEPQQEGGGQKRSRLSGKRVSEEIFEQVDAEDEQEEGEEARQTSKGARKSTAQDQSFGRASLALVVRGCGPHGSNLAGIARVAVCKNRFLGAKEIEIFEHGWSIVFFERATADAARIGPLDFAGKFHVDPAMAAGIGTVPILPSFHEHGGHASLSRFNAS
jgi:hypothetical protein